MPKTNVYDMSGKQVGEIELSEALFGIEPNQSVVHDVVKNHLANCRQGTQSALTRAEVSGMSSAHDCHVISSGTVAQSGSSLLCRLCDPKGPHLSISYYTKSKGQKQGQDMENGNGCCRIYNDV